MRNQPLYGKGLFLGKVKLLIASLTARELLQKMIPLLLFLLLCITQCAFRLQRCCVCPIQCLAGGVIGLFGTGQFPEAGQNLIDLFFSLLECKGEVLMVYLVIP